MSKKFKDDLEALGAAGENIKRTCELLDLKTSAARTFVLYALANALLMDRKQQDYGPDNVSGFGAFGVVVRMNDKMMRLKNLFNKGRRAKAINESIEDTFRDIGNYAIIALMVERGEWPTT